jgi:hypothetical protein
MALNYRQQGPMARDLIAYATTHVGTDGELLYIPRDPARVYTSPQHLYEIGLRYGSVEQGWVVDELGAQATLRSLLQADRPVIVDVTVSISRGGSTAAHFVLVTGIDGDGTVHVHDPYSSGFGARRRAVPWGDFYWSWQHNSDGAVGGHGWWMAVDTPDIPTYVEPAGVRTGPTYYWTGPLDLFSAHLGEGDF